MKNFENMTDAEKIAFLTDAVFKFGHVADLAEDLIIDLKRTKAGIVEIQQNVRKVMLNQVEV
jgi:hypothetical protein